MRGRAGAARGRARRSARAGRCARTADRRGHRHAAAARVRRRRAGGRHAGRGARRRRARSTTSSPRSRPSPSTPTRPRAGSARRAAGETLLALLALAEHRVQALRVRAVRPDRRLAHGAAAAGGRRRRAVLAPDGGSGALAVRDRRQRPARGLRPVHGRGRGRARVRAQPRLRGRRAARPHQLPQLRQPREAAHRVAAHARRSRASRDACLALGVPVVGGNVSLYNEGAEGPIYPTPVVGMVGKLPDPAPCRGPASRRRAHAIALVGPVRAGARGLGAREAARQRSRDRCPRRPRRARGRARARAGGRASGGELPTAHDVSEGGLACALAECCIAGGLGARVAAGRRRRPAPLRRGPRRRGRRRPARGGRGAGRRDRHRRGGRGRARDRRAR